MSDGAPVVHLVDDDAAFLVALARFLRASRLMVQTFSSAAEFLARVSPETLGCVVIDLQMPGMDGLELQEALARTHRAMPVVFLTGQGDIPASVQAMRHGAEDFLQKLAPKEKLLDAIRRALARDARQRELKRRFSGLTEREFEVLAHVVRGQLNKQIAGDLGIHERTVKAHRTAITSKLGVPSVAELTRLTLEADIFPASTASLPKGQ